MFAQVCKGLGIARLLILDDKDKLIHDAYP